MGHLVTGNGVYVCFEDLLKVQTSRIVQEASKSLQSLAPVTTCRKNHVYSVTEPAVRVGTCEGEDVEMCNAEVEAADQGREVIAAGEEYIQGLGIVLSNWVQTAAAPHKLGRFHSLKVPPISVIDYLSRLHKYFLCSDECFVLALVYIDKVCKASSVTVCELSIHRLLFTAVMVAAKFHDDTFYSNGYYARVGGLSVKDVNALEAAMLELLGWNALVTTEEYQLYHSLVCQGAA